MFNFFKNDKETAKVYVQEPNPEKSRQLLYVDVSKDMIIGKAKEQNIEMTDDELALIRAELFDAVLKGVEESIQKHLFDQYSAVADEVLNAFGGDSFIRKIRGYRKILNGVEILLPSNKSLADSFAIMKSENAYNILFSGHSNTYLTVDKISLDEVVSAFIIITGIAKATEPVEGDFIGLDSEEAA